MVLLRTLATASLFAGLANAFIAFQTTCSSPPDQVNWVASPQVRGTIDILWSCFSVLLVCTWTIQHLSIPPRKEHNGHSWNRHFVTDAHYSTFLDDFHFNITKLKWMALSLLAPEFILAKALAEWLAARDSQRKVGRKEWTTTHGFFANMRGFVLRFDVTAVPKPLEPCPPTKYERSFFTPSLAGDSPYVPQDPKLAEIEEIKHCYEICGPTCESRLFIAPEKDRETAAGRGSGPKALTAMKSGNNEPCELTTGLPTRPNWTEGMAKTLATPSSLARQPTDDSMAFTPSTLVNSPTNTPLVERRGYHMNTTPTATLDGHSYPLPSSTTLIPSRNDPNPQNQTIDEAFPLHEVHQHHTTATIAKEIVTLAPHETWKATWALSSMQMHYAYHENLIPLPDVSGEDLNDKSKGDALVKGAAVLQITWLVVQIIARAFQSLAISQLEITVLAFAACAIVTYFLLWHKPQDVKMPMYIDIPHTLTREQIIQLAARSPVSTLSVHQFWLHGVAIRTMAGSVFPWTPGIRVQLLGMKKPVFLNQLFVGIGLGGAIFGGIHFAAWNFQFPSEIEAILWRTSCTWLVAFPPIGITIYCVAQHIARKSRSTDTKLSGWLRPLGYVTLPIYLLARLYLLVEVFRCLAYPPPSLFQAVSWPSAIPHVY